MHYYPSFWLSLSQMRKRKVNVSHCQYLGSHVMSKLMKKKLSEDFSLKLSLPDWRCNTSTLNNINAQPSEPL